MRRRDADNYGVLSGRYELHVFERDSADRRAVKTKEKIQRGALRGNRGAPFVYTMTLTLIAQ